MKFLDRLILMCVALFVMVTVNLATATTAVQQKAKRTGLNTASPNQMFSQQLGTELMMNSKKLIVLTYDFDKAGPTSGTFTFKDKLTGETGKVPKCHTFSQLTGGFATVSTPKQVNIVSGSGNLDVIASGTTVIDDFDLGTYAPLIGTDIAIGATVNGGISSCAGDVTVTGNITSGTVRSGQLDLILEVTPFNQPK